MGSAQLKIEPQQEGAATDSALKQAVAERVAQHRAKEAARRTQPEPEAAPEPALTERAARARAVVAARYAKTPSYREMLAAESERSVREAEAAAEVAARNAQAIVQAQRQLLAELGHLPSGEAAPVAEQMSLVDTEPLVEPKPAKRPVAAKKAVPAPRQYAPEELRVQLEEALPALAAPPVAPRMEPQPEPADVFEQRALDEEIEFRQSPEFGVHEPLPANLIEFPRQLVAAVKARPRLAEGPLREDAEETDQLRIFEVEASQVSTTPAVELPQTEWTPLVLETAARHVEPVAEPEPVFLPQVAPIGLRVMAAMVDGCVVLGAALAFLALAAVEMRPLPQRYLVAGLPAALLVLHMLYQLLFFTWSESTPGMRYARIGLCTFNDDNPTRGAMRRRILASILAAAPLGLGFLWAILDEDGLGWHDRISRIYQRSY